MTEETENLILRLLRDIRAKQDEHSEKFVEQDVQFSELRKSIEDWQEKGALR